MVFNIVLSSSLFGLSTHGGTAAAIIWPLEPAWAIIVACLPAFRAITDQGLRWTSRRFQGGRFLSRKNSSGESEGYLEEGLAGKPASQVELKDIPDRGHAGIEEVAHGPITETPLVQRVNEELQLQRLSTRDTGISDSSAPGSDQHLETMKDKDIK
ncbi:hypothetical protein ABW20_dc0106849 [Dactylellina cionopaga]|nr:hypothetical protein ABW20_dc0106849 [Dactylellina cionopaga]